MNTALETRQVTDTSTLPSQISPGVWKFDLGQPDKITPLSVLCPSPDADRFAALPCVSDCPVSAAAIFSRPTSRGFEIRLPLRSDEKVYGFGLQLLSFNQTGLKRTLRVNSDPRVDLGDSHAPVPLYVSTAGYAVMIDTARYATFYCGSTSSIARECVSKNKESVVSMDVKTGTVHYASEPPKPSREMVIEVPSAEGAAVLVFAGPSLREAVQRYNLFSGGGCMPRCHRSRAELADSRLRMFPYLER
jgi:alpha-D-xyloside xylohydrolase